jgi:hypothetical protein
VKAAALIFVTAVIVAAALLFGALRLGSSGPLPLPIVLHGVRQDQPSPRRPERLQIRQRVDQATVSAYSAHDAKAVRP